MRKEGALVPICAVIYHYDFTNRESPFEKMNPPCTLAPLITFPYLLSVAEEEKLLSEETIAILKRWYADPFSWGETRGMAPLAK